jgi:hypothetical protein
VVADGLSRQWEGHTPLKSDGSNWTVNPDTDETIGLTNDILATLEAGSHEQVTALKNCLQNEHLFIEVIDTITAQDTMGTVRQQKRARHRASQYILKNRKLWKLHGGTSARART